jgi:hypothetical protein
MGRTVRTQPSGIQGTPLATGAEHKENRLHGPAVSDTRMVASYRMGLTGWQERLHMPPQPVRDAPAVIGNPHG